MTSRPEKSKVFTQHDKFLTHYQEFLTHHNHYQKIFKAIEQEQIPSYSYEFLLQLYLEAKQAYCRATDSYNQAIEANQEYREEIFTNSLK